jgi:hypothetical protein
MPRGFAFSISYDYEAELLRLFSLIFAKVCKFFPQNLSNKHLNLQASKLWRLNLFRNTGFSFVRLRPINGHAVTSHC